MDDNPVSLGTLLSDQAGRMLPSVKSEWTRALRGAQFNQLFGSTDLCLEVMGIPRWNALGVLCHLLDVPWERDVVPYTSGNTTRRWYAGSTASLPPRALVAAQLVKRGPLVERIYIDQSLFIQNYSIRNLSAAGTPFARLADFIDEQL